MKLKEFFHCYHPSEIVQSRKMYNFLPRKPSLSLMCKTPNSNRNWKSQYFFLQGDDWMCHPDDQKFMLVDKTWGIMPMSGRCLSVLNFTCYYWFHMKFWSYPIAAQDRLEFSLEQWSFLERISKTKLSERICVNLVTLDTIHWYCEGPKPTKAACHHDNLARQRKFVAYYFSFLIYSSFA